MGFSTLSALLPKRLLFSLAAVFAGVFLVYFKGVSDGREPYKQAAKSFEIKSKIITEQTKVNRTTIKQKGVKAHVKADEFVCTISGVTADWLSNIKP